MNIKINDVIEDNVSIIPVIRFNKIGETLLAITAASAAKPPVDAIQISNICQVGIESIIKCEVAPIKAVKVIIKTDVPTAFLNS